MTPATRWQAGLLLAFGAVLCALPLLDLLAYEAAFFAGIPVVLVSGHRGARRGAAPSELLRTAGLALLPVAPLTANMLRVRNCNYLEGLAFYALLPGVGALAAHLAGAAAAHIAPRHGFRLFVGGLLATILYNLAQFWLTPVVDLFNPFLGYFPGSLYDEIIPLTGRLLGSRAADLGYALGALLLCLGLKGRRARPVLGGAALCAGAWVAGEGLLLHRTEARIQAALGGAAGLTETPHFTIHHPRNAPPRRLARLGLDLEFRHAELTDFFGRAPAERIDVWLYRSAAQKKRLMGAGNVRIAKPWQRAVHLQWPDLGDGILAHELAHAFSAEISAPPHHLSLTPWGLPNMGLIEGTATAAAWDDAPLDAHQWSAAMRQLGVGGELETLLSPHGFLATNSRAAYTQCGSFVRYLRDTRGAAEVEALYRTGTLPDLPLPEAIVGWRDFLATQPVDTSALAVARVRFDRPALFGRICAHEVAALRERLEGLRGPDPEGALAVADALLVHLPGDPDTLLARVSLLARRTEPDDWRAARELALGLAARPELGRVRQARAAEWAADLAAREVLRTGSDGESVRAAYDDLLAQSFDRAWTRRLAVKRAALSDGRAGPAVLAFLVRPDDADAAAGDALLARALKAAPEAPIVRYLVGRLAARRGRCDEATAWTRGAVARGLPHPALVLEAARLIAACDFDLDRFESAAAAFTALAARTDLGLQGGEAADLATWGRRARFFAAHPLPTGTPQPAAEAEQAASARPSDDAGDADDTDDTDDANDAAPAR